jgi:hypothetical protein
MPWSVDTGAGAKKGRILFLNVDNNFDMILEVVLKPLLANYSQIETFQCSWQRPLYLPLDNQQDRIFLIVSMVKKMNHKSLLSASLIFLLVLFSVVIALRPLSATPVSGESPDIILKISDLEKNLNLIDHVLGIDESSDGASLSNQIRQLLQTTDWIDPSRSIVVGVELKDPQSTAALLIPFRQHNEAFQTNFGARSEMNSYIVSLPPGQPVGISNAFNSALKAASQSKSKYFISLEMGLRRLIEKGDQQIQQMLSKLETMPQAEGSQQMPFKPDDVQEMIRNMLDTAAMLETLSISLDMSKEKLSFLTEARAESGTELAKLFVSKAGASLLSRYRPAHQINFRSRSYDFEGLLELIEKSFGNIYAKMGFDFSEIAAISRHFNGEMVGGISFDRDMIQFEGMYVLKDPKAAPDFARSVYLPWMEKFNQSVVQNMEALSGQKIDDIFVRTKESKVAGRKVYGVRFNMPAMPESNQQTGFPAQALMKDFEYRFTTVGSLFVFAQNDRQIGKLIKKAKTLKSTPAKGALMVMDFDMGSYFEFVQQTMPGAFTADQPLPKLGKMVFTLDFKNGRAFSSSSLMINDLKNIITHVSQGVLGKTPAGFGPAEQKEAPSTGLKTAADSEQAAYWFKKGALCATYGNDRVAIKYFEKAITLDPESSKGYFEQGISYGQLGEYQKAIALIDQAIRMESQNGLYYYGRGRVYLLSGDKDKALVDFKKAAEFGDQDAIKYLEDTSKSSS